MVETGAALVEQHEMQLPGDGTESRLADEAEGIVAAAADGI